MLSPRERLTHLLDLADQGPGHSAALAMELADLLLDWPAHYPPSMRAPFEALLEKTAREVGGATRGLLAARFEQHPELPTPLLNEFFIDASPALKSNILARNDQQHADADVPLAADGAALLAAAREGAHLDSALSAMTGLSRDYTRAIISDESGLSLSVVLKGARLARPICSAIMLLTASSSGQDEIHLVLARFEEIPQNAAEQLLSFWRTHHGLRNGAKAA